MIVHTSLSVGDRVRNVNSGRTGSVSEIIKGRITVIMDWDALPYWIYGSSSSFELLPKPEPEHA